MRQAAQAYVCPDHHTSVTCVGDLDASPVLTGTCPIGGEQRSITTVPGVSPGSPSHGAPVSNFGAPGGVHDPSKDVALGLATPTPEPAFVDEPELAPLSKHPAYTGVERRVANVPVAVERRGVVPVPNEPVQAFVPEEAPPF
jgi:hypothetical protein